MPSTGIPPYKNYIALETHRQEDGRRELRSGGRWSRLTAPDRKTAVLAAELVGFPANLLIEMDFFSVIDLERQNSK